MIEKEVPVFKVATAQLVLCPGPYSAGSLEPAKVVDGNSRRAEYFTRFGEHTAPRILVKYGQTTPPALFVQVMSDPLHHSAFVWSVVSLNQCGTSAKPGAVRASRRQTSAEPVRNQAPSRRDQCRTSAKPVRNQAPTGHDRFGTSAKPVRNQAWQAACVFFVRTS